MLPQTAGYQRAAKRLLGEVFSAEQALAVARKLIEKPKPDFGKLGWLLEYSG